MKKGLWGILMVMIVLLSASMAVGATVYYDEDFSDPSFLTDKTKITYTVEANPPSGEYSILEVVTEDRDVTGDGVPDGVEGTLHFKNTVTSSSLKNVNFQLKFPAEYSAVAGESIYMYDLMLPDVTTYNVKTIIAMIYYGGVRHNAYFDRNAFQSAGGNISTGGHIPGQWYTYMYTVDKDKTVVSIYRKLQSEPDSSFVLLGSSNLGAVTAGPYFYWYTYNGRNSEVYLDNIKLYTGTNVVSQKFTLDGNEISEISELEPGELEGNITILANKEKSGLHKFLVAYDKDDNLLGCTVVKKNSESFIYGHNEITEKMNLDAESAAALADGGYVGMYIWEGLNPIMIPLELY